MPWTHLMSLPLYKFLSPKLRKEGEKVNAAIQELTANRADIDGKRAELRKQDVAEVNFRDLVNNPAMRATVLLCLQNELKVRERIRDFFTKMYDECHGAITVANTTHQERKEEVRAALTSIGYPAKPTDERDPIVPGFINSHPTVREAIAYNAELQAWSNDRAHARANDEAVSKVTEQLSRVRDAA